DGLLMAMTVEDHFPGEGRRPVIGSLAREKLAQQERLAPQAFGARIRWEQASQFVAEDRGAARFENDDRKTRVERRSKRAKDALQIILRANEEAEVIERPAAAQRRR